jgi:hypothetical protein
MTDLDRCAVLEVQLMPPRDLSGASPVSCGMPAATLDSGPVDACGFVRFLRTRCVCATYREYTGAHNLIARALLSPIALVDTKTLKI